MMPAQIADGPVPAIDLAAIDLAAIDLAAVVLAAIVLARFRRLDINLIRRLPPD